ncbi:MULTISPECIES: GNAT family N-acetyltransferase [Ensifer]|jgi:RimJ/RimL family protein N-acetyltransferase|uniref:GNAT family N-acetyltransferase n=1 Tax=Ensifer canadensis TaxID=555315 RepID=A0AAW4FM67_9HYPH|nr:MULTISPECIES: GNAT family N-acetyltransferase [Ensifer]AHK44817.1 GCN5-related N-acetyltransferase [Ensifer adhaerens OV14]MDP9632273.1 RimJ/RimL family protein N-acetyltransferase [Ensifer adhaerens]KQU74040.1 GNAT family acetyltransferase [Ensifer sp. Root31]KQW58498.1 GNAT family acetyltransferase [Ensifer sp. Root1252]KQW62455.1 GNAT family acetyltransferase [Ensifer sp. Root127]
MIVSETERLRIRAWKEADRDLFFEINNDAEVMAFFPHRRNREETDALFDRVGQGIAETGLGFFAVALKKDDRPIGFCGLAYTDLEPHLPKGTVEIGWRLAAPFWGKGYITEAASDLLRYGFDEKGLREIVSFAVPDNTRSTAVMARLGMHRDPARDFNHPRIPADKPQLVRHVLYAITRAEWQAQRAKDVA